MLLNNKKVTLLFHALVTLTSSPTVI